MSETKLLCGSRNQSWRKKSFELTLLRGSRDFSRESRTRFRAISLPHSCASFSPPAFSSRQKLDGEREKIRKPFPGDVYPVRNLENIGIEYKNRKGRHSRNDQIKVLVLSLVEIFVGKFKSSQTVKILTKKCSLFLFCIFPKITGLYFPFLVFPRSLHSVLNLEEMHEDDKAFIASQSPYSLCVYFRSRKRGRK